MSAAARCDCLECNYRRQHLSDATSQSDMRLVLAMVALSRVMLWVSLCLEDARFTAQYGLRLPAETVHREVVDRLEFGYFRLVYA